ncbi:MAG: UDP-N-acetylglucosamine 1-carboxyvinyltransferase [Flavobacteriales bacterium]|jgi:UDP-N-acetylglucosamine 1-carboxyvinyltransferase|uniref:UDP-N-acetylglucosamine 1-carboxyvinyltransferase n=1 Tax=Blattabacterium sp. (Mastotermes darwiniensis) TaxID=39768 RepID=UPI000231DECA|nr:UDP-N-acetylglucosamine 1-carboxyvinyltransferase [Blattabacterium sp. (Mastotermes darwiniensis)]AER40766.1 UDP-N-acetylglucosamine-1-carboxyvinyltransferase [Blattabacterium sp. (Mastotermes darwiniensis) str. MADAR]MDR1804609.1 UDP-N-acetylglucosamine 1-carboxyvinyltransferase [Flavobacteriales bacterium]
MASFKIVGGSPLKGEIKPQGAKNEALQVLCAVLLTSEKLRIKNIPEIGDVKCLMQILQNLGVIVKKNNIGDYTFQAKDIQLEYLNTEKFREYGKSIRGSVMIAGPLLARFGKVCMPIPGGDRIGRRRLDAHLRGFESLGSHIDYKEGQYFLIHSKYLTGKFILLEESSITGTANIIMAATLAKGKTTIYNAACEPYIQQLCRLLNKMGAKIKGIGSNLINITGVTELGGCRHSILPDMIEIGSWIGLAAITSSEIKIRNVSWKNLGIIPNIFQKMGIKLEKKNDDIYIPSQKYYKIKKLLNNAILTISDAPWPGLTPDLLSILTVVATQAKGSVLIHQKMFESRLFFVDKLIEMGAQIILCDPHRATVIGLNHQSSLRGSILNSPDIRAGISLLIAALSAKGTSIIKNIEQIDRGYENIDQRLRILGANILRIE